MAGRNARTVVAGANGSLACGSSGMDEAWVESEYGASAAPGRRRGDSFWGVCPVGFGGGIRRVHRFRRLRFRFGDDGVCGGSGVFTRTAFWEGGLGWHAVCPPGPEWPGVPDGSGCSCPIGFSRGKFARHAGCSSVPDSGARLRLFVPGRLFQSGKMGRHAVRLPVPEWRGVRRLRGLPFVRPAFGQRLHVPVCLPPPGRIGPGSLHAGCRPSASGRPGPCRCPGVYFDVACGA